jgi:hypothetical protein
VLTSAQTGSNAARHEGVLNVGLAGADAFCVLRG